LCRVKSAKDYKRLIEHGCVRSAGRGIGAIKQRETRRKESNMNRKELIFRMATILLAANANKDNALTVNLLRKKPDYF